MGASASQPTLSPATTTSPDAATRAERAAHNAALQPSLPALLIAGVRFPHDAGAALAETCTLACNDVQLLGALSSAPAPATGRTRLMNAARQCDAARARALLAAGARARIDAVTRAPSEKSKESWFGPGAEAGLTALLYALSARDAAADAQAREAAKARREALAGLLLDAGASVQAVAGGRPPLVAAVAGRYAATVRRLLDAGAEVNARAAQMGSRCRPADAQSEPTALHTAARMKAFDLARLLLDAGADVNTVLYRDTPEFLELMRAPSTGWLTALDLAQHWGKDTRQECEDFVLELLARGAVRVGETSPTLARACELGWLRVVRALIARGDLRAPGNGHKAMFGLALDNGHLEVCQALIGASGRTLGDDTFRDALAYTCYKGGAGSLDLVQRFLAGGCDPSPQPFRGASGMWHGTPLFYAAGQGAADLVQALLAAGAAPNVLVQESRWCGTALSRAAFRDQEGAVRALLAGGARPRSSREGEECPLAAAATGGAPRALRLLLHAGQRPSPAALSTLLLTALTYNPYGQFETDREKEGGLGRRDCAAAFLVQEGGAHPTLEHLRAAFTYSLPLAARAIACALRRGAAADGASAGASASASDGDGGSLAAPADALAGLDFSELFCPQPQGGSASRARMSVYSADLTEVLVELGAPVPMALYYAAQRRCERALELALGRLGAEPNARLQLAADGSERQAQYPYAWGASPLLQVLAEEPCMGEGGGVRAAAAALLKRGADPLLRAPVRYARTLYRKASPEAQERSPLELLCWRADTGDLALAALLQHAPALPAPPLPADLLGCALLGALHHAHAALARALLERGALPCATAALQQLCGQLPEGWGRPPQSALAVARGEGWHGSQEGRWEGREAQDAERGVRAELVRLLKSMGAEEAGWAAAPLARGWRGCWDGNTPLPHVEELLDYPCWELVDEARGHRTRVSAMPVAGAPLSRWARYETRVEGGGWRHAREIPGAAVEAEAEGVPVEGRS